MTTAHSESHSFVTKMIELFGDWLKQRRQLKELMQFGADPGELERVAREFVTYALRELRGEDMRETRRKHGRQDLVQVL